jgi:hypothetical protein
MDKTTSASAPTSAAASDGKADASDQSLPPAALANNQDPRDDVELVNEPEQSPRKLKGIKWIVCVLSIFSSVFLYALDNTIVATIQPTIINDLGHLEKLPWVSVAYQVTSVALDLTWYGLAMFWEFRLTKTRLGESCTASSMAKHYFSPPFSYSKLAPLSAALHPI